MKRKYNNRTLISYFVIWSVILSSLLLYSPKDIVVSASGVPEIKMLTPVADAVLNVSTVEFIGKISDDLTTPDKLPVKVFEQLGDSQQPIDITDEGTLKITPQDHYADFTFSKEFSEGIHTLTFVVSDGEFSNQFNLSITVNTVETNQTNVSVVTDNNLVSQEPSSSEYTRTGQVSMKVSRMSLFSEETGRPYMYKMYLIPKDAVDEYKPLDEGVLWESEPDYFLPVEDMTRVPVDYILLIDVRSTEGLTTSKPLITESNDFKGKPDFIKSVELSDGMNANIYTFTPEKLLPKTSYYVYLNPEFTNEIGDKHIIPRFLKFTTVSANHQDVGDFTNPAEVPDSARSLDFNIHGNYSNVTNACSYCHSTHNGKNDKLEGGEFGISEENLCMACHDGTTGTMIAPKVVNNKDELKTNQHYQISGNSCTSCHNPHIPGTKENPNSFKSVTNTDSHIRTYKKASTATGNADDFSLCLSCHNGTKKDEESQNVITDINQYYSDPFYINQSGHKIKATADSGSNLDGQIPCAECHDTHGSNNIKMLRADLGNIKITDDKDKFISSGIVWNAENEREFCSKCHNGSTKIYGVTGKAIFNKDSGIAINPDIPDHNMGTKNEEKACSACHSNGGENPFREAAHAPKIITNP